MADDLPRAVRAEAERLTRLARETDDDGAAEPFRERRATLLAEHGYVARVRDAEESRLRPGSTGGTGARATGTGGDGDRDVLVLHPAEWIEDGTARLGHIEDLSRAVEIPLGRDAPEWGAVEEHNRSIATRVEREFGEVHGANAHAFADFMGNHYARRVEDASRADVEEFLAEYFPRNAWPSDEQRDAVLESLERVFSAAGESAPPLPDSGADTG